MMLEVEDLEEAHEILEDAVSVLLSLHAVRPLAKNR